LFAVVCQRRPLAVRRCHRVQFAVRVIRVVRVLPATVIAGRFFSIIIINVVVIIVKISGTARIVCGTWFYATVGRSSARLYVRLSRLTLVDLLWLIFRWSSNVLFDLNNTQKLLFASVLTILRLIKITILLKLELSYLACTQKFVLL